MSTRLAVREARDSLVPSERALSELWRNAHSLSDGLLTEDGRRMRVLYPGRPSARAGPDFRDAVIATESGDVIVGDVELHLRAPDWYAHRHHLDPNYNGVVLHVVLTPGAGQETGQQSGTTTPIVSVRAVVPRLIRADGASTDAATPDAFTEDAGAQLDRAGDLRFAHRSRGFSLELRGSDPEQVLYGALMEALGYASNRRPFRTLARRAPWSSLVRLADEPAGTRLIAIEATLLGAAGLLATLQPEERRQLGVLRRMLPKTRPMSTTRWSLHRVRPANHPVSRVRGAARIVDRHLRVGLVRAMREAVQATDDGAAAVVRSLTASPFVGESRARDMSVNVVLPFLHALGKVRREPRLPRRCLEAYAEFPSLSANEVTREMTRHLGIDASLVKGARRQQGLMHLYGRLVRPSRGAGGPSLQALQ